MSGIYFHLHLVEGHSQFDAHGSGWLLWTTRQRLIVAFAFFVWQLKQNKKTKKEEK